MAASLDLFGISWGLRGQAQSQGQHPLPPSLLCSGVCSGNFGAMSDGLMLLPGNPLCWYLLWPVAFPLLFVLLAGPALVGVWCWGAAALSQGGSGRLTLAACARAGGCRWAQTAKWPGDNFVTYLADMLCMANTIPLPVFQSWPVLYWQADHFLSKPVTSLLSLWGFLTGMFAEGGKQTTFFCVQGLRDTERFVREQCSVGWGEDFHKTPLPFCRNLGIESFRLQYLTSLQLRNECHLFIYSLEFSGAMGRCT